MENKSKKLKAKDFITIGIFTAILFAVEFALGMLGYIHPFIVASYVIILPLASGIPMMLFYTKVEKFGMITIVSVLLAIIMFVGGMGYLGAPLIIISGLVADFIAKSGNYKSFKKTVLSFGVFNLWICSNYFPILVTAESYRKDLIDGGFSAEYANNLFAAINVKTIGILVVLCFDPRTKLFMVFVVSLIAMMSATTPVLWVIRIIITLIPIVLLILEKKYSSALRFFLAYGIALVLLLFFISENSEGIIASLLIGYCGIVVQFMPALITAWYVIRTTKIGEFMSCMQKMHIPDGIAVSLAVVMRFFPTIKEEYSSINDAMRMRGVMLGGGNVLRMFEFRMIPLLFSCVNIGEELSAAAITRGLGGETKRSSLIELKLGLADYLLMAFLTAATVIFVMYKYFL